MSEFLAEAQVLITPDTTKFRALLAAELATITKGVPPVVIPVVAGAASTADVTNRTRRAARDAADALQVQGAASKEASASARDLARAQGLAGVAGNKLAVAQGAVANAASAVGSAQITATRSTAAVTAAQRALDAALRSQDVALISTARNTLTLAEAQAASASAALAAARAQTAQASSLGSVSRGAGATALSLTGVRGATLAASGSFLAGAAAVALFAKAVQSAAGLESELSVFKVTAGATADEMQRVAAEARALGRDIRLPGVSSRDAAESMSQLARAGLEVEDSIAGARGVLQLAAAAQISNAEATELAASALNAFQLSGDEAVHVADILATSANEAQGSITDMGIALRQSAAIADLVGLSLEDTAGFLTILARAGLKGSDAGTSFRVALQRLIAPTKDAVAALDTLNIRLRDSQGRLRPELFFELGDALGELSVKQRQATLVTIFGADASRAAALIGREQLSTLRELQSAYQEQGSAAELAAARNVGLTGQMSALTSNLETLGTSLGQVVLPALTGLVQSFNELVTGAGEVITVVSELGRVVDEFGQEFLGLPDSGSFMKDVAKQVIRSTVPIKDLTSAVIGLRGQFGQSGTDIQADARSITRDVQALFRAFQDAGGGPTALNQMVLALDEMADKLARGDAEAIRLGRELREIIREVQQFGNLPPSVIDIQARLDESQVTAETDKTSARIIENLERLGGPMAELGIDLITSLGDGMKSAAPTVAEETGQILIQSLGTQLAVAEATGAGDQEILGILREREARQAAFLDKMLNRPQTKAVQKTIEKAARNLEQTRNQIQGILDQQASDAKSAAAKAVTAQSEADQAAIDSIGGREAKLQNAVLIATATETQRDNIRANTALRNFYKSVIAEAKATIKDAKTRGEVVAALIADQIRASISLRSSQRALNEAIKQEARDAKAAAAERTANLIERAQLDVAFAVTIENVDREIRARRSLIAQYKKAQQAAKGNINEVKRYRNLIAAETAAIEELQGAKKEQGTTLGQLTFDFFTKQQGFVANLLGNLIPGSATAGLVGGSQTTTSLIPDPGAGLQVQAAAKSGGPTFGQAATEVDILKQVLQVLREIRSGRSHPEAALQRAQVNATMDFQGGV